ncbi:hypothetical protein GV827_15755 [Sulfitobacter sp. JBTF-M27]|uniref:Uncharacterized protein n=1 Tax=Sulfitobacter sediminilitoris TaxID=2698830 RepID=A0A6P0CCF8_9RHOB|nr:hypothetical protein [Sulfitobacter sediminilitoris]NEK23852.1 hypothetical protein [Sulfitobacter sediminilitoris]
MKSSNGAQATRQQAIAAAHRLSSLVQLTQHDQFLHETMQYATDVIARSGLLSDALQMQTHASPRDAKRHFQ